MSKVKFIRTTIVQIDIDPENYPEGLSVDEMARFDINHVKESGDYEALFADNVISDEIKYQVIYDPTYGDNRICECDHEYYRHFDTYDNMYPCGCKYCGCHEFKEK